MVAWWQSAQARTSGALPCVSVQCSGTWPPPVGIPPAHTGRTLGRGPDLHILPIFDFLGGLEKDRAEIKDACHPDLCHYKGRETEAQLLVFEKDLC